MTEEQRNALLALYYVVDKPDGTLQLYRLRGGYERDFDTQDELDAYLDDIVRAVTARLAA